MRQVSALAYALASVSAAQDLLEITAPAGAACRLLKLEVTQDTSETSEQLVLQLVRRTTAGTGGSAKTPAKHRTTATAIAYTAQGGVTTPGTAGDVLWRAGSNVLNGWLYRPFPSLPVSLGVPTDETIVIAPGERLAVHLPTAPGSATNFSVHAVVEELG